MAEPTQKQIASKYKDDLTYYKKTHPFRRLRFWLTMLAFIGGLVWAVGFHRLGGSSQFFNTGPISENHARFANDCAACHTGASTDMLSILPVEQTRAALHQGAAPLLEDLKSAGKRAVRQAEESIADPQKLAAAAHAALSRVSLDSIDRACLSCHDGMSLHQPGAKAVMFRESQKELSVVAAAACSSCHLEHVGTARMKLPTSETCIDCHGNEKKMADSLQTAKYDGQWAAIHSQNVRLGDFVQWLPAAKTGEKPKIVNGFEQGHPAFLYEGEGAKDQAQIKFNHARHFADDITKLNGGQKLDCRSCHVPDSDGIGIQRISYDQHCQKCHSLGADPDLPGFTIPHRDPQKVRDFLASLYTQWTDYAGKHFNITDAATLKAFLEQRGEKFRQRWPASIEEVQQRVFYTGDPPIERANSGQFLPACVKCHTVKDAKPVPAIEKTNIPDGWLTRGPFKHAAHLHMQCQDCHGGAEKSKETTDILLPAQKSCAECHRERDYSKVETIPTERIAPTFGEYSPAAAQKQRREGGVFNDCLGCHKYHVPAAEMEIARSLLK
jgi:hypothetical protein